MLPAGVVEFLIEQPGMRLMRDDVPELSLGGTYILDATHSVAGRVSREYELSIWVPSSFPSEAPKVFEQGDKIPKEADYHVNPDFSMCLGSPLALKRILRRWPNLQEFLARTLRPYLYAVTLKLDNGGEFAFGELRHGEAGELQGLSDDLQIPERQLGAALDLLLMSVTEADGQPCPCGCGKELRACATKGRVDEVRELASRNWLQRMYAAVSS